MAGYTGLTGVNSNNALRVIRGLRGMMGYTRIYYSNKYTERTTKSWDVQTVFSQAARRLDFILIHQREN